MEARRYSGRMATRGERQALLFLAAVALLGAGSRIWRSREVAPPTGDLDGQIAAVESPLAHGKRGRAKPRFAAKSRDSVGPDSTHNHLAATAAEPTQPVEAGRPVKDRR